MHSETPEGEASGNHSDERRGEVSGTLNGEPGDSIAGVKPGEKRMARKTRSQFMASTKRPAIPRQLDRWENWATRSIKSCGVTHLTHRFIEGSLVWKNAWIFLK